MHNLRAFYNQNRKKIWQIVIFLGFLIVIFFVGRNYMLKQAREKNKIENLQIANNNKEQEIDTTKENVVIKSDNGDKSNNGYSTKTNIVKNTISKFVEQIKDGDIEASYAMLTDDCKKVLYPSQESFYKNYVQENFSYGVTFEIENWISNTYKVNIIPDLISTGEIEEGKNKLDYITVEKDGEEYKLNVNSYIGRRNVNERKEIDNFIINVNYKDVFMNYETYNFTLENNKNNVVVLDDLTNINSIYLLTRNGKKDYAHANELTKESLRVGIGEKKNLNIKFYSRYVSNKRISSIVFSNVRGISIKEDKKYETIVIDI